MKNKLRLFYNRLFTFCSGFAVMLMTLALAVILLPMLWRGGQAVVFSGTVEFREMQFDVFDRGSREALNQELAAVQAERAEIYNLLQTFKDSLNLQFEKEVDAVYDAYRDHIDPLPTTKKRTLRRKARDVRIRLTDIFESNDRDMVQDELKDIMAEETATPEFENSPAMRFFDLARSYQNTISEIDLEKRDFYLAEIPAIEQALCKLFGPLPTDPTPTQAMMKYGATRMDMAKIALEKLLYKENWVEVDPDKPLVNKPLPRKEIFAGTMMESLFEKVETNLDAMLRPQKTVYWQYFIDDNIDQYYFGGVGPEILGTLILTLVSMAFAVPLGIIAAAYLVECAGDNMVIRMIRMCINTLAGVPSIVFGLFGLAFFAGVFMPKIGQSPKPCVMTASLTLAILTLPVIIRASEEAIRGVPPTFKQASLALGAGHFRTFTAVTLPAALPGILTGIILGLSRAAGETAPILLTGAVTSGHIPQSLFDQTRALSTGAFNIAVGSANAPQVPHQQYGMVSTLILLVLLLNVIAIVIRSRTAKKMRGY